MVWKIGRKFSRGFIRYNSFCFFFMSINEFLKWRIKSGMLKTVAGRGMRKFKAQTEDDKPHLQIKPPLSPVPLSFGSCYSKQRFNIPRLGIASAGLWTRWEGDNSAHQFAHLRVRPWRFTEFDAGPLRHHLKVIRNPGNQRFAFGIRYPELWNPKSSQEIHNSPNDWNLEFKFHWKGIQNLLPGIQNPSDSHRSFARWRHFTTTTRILQAFAFLCKFGLLL